MTRRELLGMGSVGVIAAIIAGRFALSGSGTDGAPEAPLPAFPVKRSEAQWRAMLSPAAYHVLREAGTETPYTSPLVDEHRPGTFACAGCANELFGADTKFESGTGWPSFWQVLKGAVIERPDRSFGQTRTEVLCADCGGHLGHVFDDGPKPTGLRYCMNGIAMAFTPANGKQGSKPA